jgi:hypothetical protein
MIDPITQYILESTDKKIFKEEVIKILTKEGYYDNALKDFGDPVASSGTAGNVIKAGVIAAAVIAAGVLAYKKYLSKAARTCQGRTDKEKCMAKYKQDAIKAQMKILSSNKSKCSKTKNPAKCAAKIDQKISSLKVKLSK